MFMFGLTSRQIRQSKPIREDLVVNMRAASALIFHSLSRRCVTRQRWLIDR